METARNFQEVNRMSRKDFVKFAASIRELLEVSGNEPMVRRFAETVAQVCQESNSNFNRQRFFDACGLGE